ncbi:MAG: hypothetical protein JJE19_02030 [Methanosarcinales archaeon]|nr:hypothetical protein [Methanosarcinales archaeon]
MERIGKTVIIFSLLGVCILYVISLFITPPFVPLDDISLHEGTVIRTSGVITEFSVTEYGDVLMKIEGNKTELPIFVESANDRTELLNLSYGDEIEVEGRVQVYRGDYELIVSGNAIKEVTPQKSNISFVAQIAAQPEEYRGKKIRVAGYVEDVYTRVFYLRDEPGNHRMRVKLRTINTNSISELHEGDKIIAEGMLSYNAGDMRYELNLIGFEVL